MNGRRALLRAAAALPLVLSASPDAAPYSDADFSLELPAGYIGPVEHVAGTAVSRGFRKPYPGTPLNTVILVTVQQMGASFGKRVAAERARLTRETLDPVVGSIERNRVGFRKSAPRPVTLGGVEGLALRWSGSAQGIAFEGEVYCVLVGARAYAIQVQDPAGRGQGRLEEAIAAVERIRIPH